MSKSKQKGTLAETAVADYLRQTFPAVERRALQGKFDTGDIAGVPGCVVEVKNQRSYKIQEWMRETETERVNAAANLGVLVIKPVGIGVSRVSDWWAVVSLETITRLIEELESAKRLQSSCD
jgi:hydrogenase maturation factor